MKQSLILLAALAAGLAASAKTLSPEEALSRVESVPSRPGIATAAFNSPQLVYTQLIPSTDTPAVYVFEGGKQGYMVLSADDAVAPVLGFSENGSFDPQSMPENLRWWLEEYARQISWAALSPSGVSASTADADDFEPIEPMCATTWNQDAPYNLQTPEFSGSHAPTGCAATAMAQVMKYHNWPEKGEGEKSYAWNNTTMNMNFGETTFDWANMLDSYTDGYNAEQGQAVATLMKACGVSIEMNYGPSESGAAPSNIVNALTSYFGYDKSAICMIRSYFTPETWKSMIWKSLRNYGPIVYSGYGYYDNGNMYGHSFVCDGYLSDGYFHFNWGWGGAYDGYYVLSALEPGAGGIGAGANKYNFDQNAILNICPARPDSEYTPFFSFVDGLSCSLQGKVLTINKPWNIGVGTFTVWPGVRCVSEDGNEYFIWAEDKLPTLMPTYYAYDYKVDLSDLGYGVYQIFPIYSLSDTPSSSNYYDFAIDANPKYFTYRYGANGGEISIDEAKKIEFQSIWLETKLMQQKPFKLGFILSNPNDYPVEVDVLPVFFSAKDNTFLGNGNSVHLEIDAKGEYTCEGEVFNMSRTVTAGTVLMGLGVMEGNTILYWSDLQEVEVEEWKYAKVSVEVDAIRPSESVFSEVTVDYSVVGEKGYFTDALWIAAFPGEGGTSLIYTPMSTLFVNADETVSESYTFTIPGAVPGATYQLAIYYEGKPLTDYLFFTLHNPSGIEDVEIEEQGTTEYFDLQGRKVDGGNLLPGIYISRTVTASGIKTSKVYVK